MTASFTAGHSKDCGYHLDQYPGECTCPIGAKMRETMEKIRGQSLSRLMEGMPTSNKLTDEKP